MILKTVQFLSIILAGLMLVPAGAHLIALSNKIGMTKEQYFIAQSVYWGWALSGIVVAAALIVDAILTFMLRGRPLPFWLAMVAFLGVAASLVIFFVWTQPANKATAFWTVPPDNWEALRIRWEYSHAASAIIAFVNLCALTASALASHSG